MFFFTLLEAFLEKLSRGKHQKSSPNVIINRRNRDDVSEHPKLIREKAAIEEEIN